MPFWPLQSDRRTSYGKIAARLRKVTQPDCFMLEAGIKALCQATRVYGPNP